MQDLRTAVSTRVRELIAGERGQGMVEYAFILVFVALVVIVAVTLLGHQVNNAFSNISNGLSH